MTAFLIRLAVLSLVPALLISYGSNKLDSTVIHSIYTSNEQEANFKLFAFVVGTVISAFIVPGMREWERRRLKKFSELNKALLDSTRKAISNEFEKILLTEEQKGAGTQLKLNIRVFVPKRKTSLKDFLYYKRRYFVIKEYQGLNVKQIEKIVFQVWPKGRRQGLIGKAYCEKEISYDFNLKKNHVDPLYRLEKHQLNITNYCNFAIAAPIFKPLSNKLVAIVSFDSEVRVPKPKGENWKETIRISCKLVTEIHQKLK